MGMFFITKRRAISIYLVIFAIIMTIIAFSRPFTPIGEWDDYSLPVASMLNDYNFGISSEDIDFYTRLFPELSQYIDYFSISPFTTKSGSGQMTYYFPTYSVLCIPATFFLWLLHVPRSFAFALTNIIVLLFSLWFLCKHLRTTDLKKNICIVALTINPIVFYISWASAEVLIYALLIMCMVCWYNKWYKRAAIFVSIAGTLNPTIMSIGIVMIFDYFLYIIRKKSASQNMIEYLASAFLDIVKFGCCFSVALVPMVYNYYNIGHINLSSTVVGLDNIKSVLLRAIAYLFDLNYGILPYFAFILGLSVLLAVGACFKKHFDFIVRFLSFLGLVFAYSIMMHINCGMSGIARYNAWSSAIIVLSVVLYYDEILSRKMMIDVCKNVIYVGIVITGCIVIMYNPYRAENAPYVYMAPIAECVLEYTPEVYNPLFSTFNSRVSHLDGAYDYWESMPIIYEDDDGYVRKILADSTNKEDLSRILFAANGKRDYLEREINSLNGDAEYINFPKKEKIVKATKYELGTPLSFSSLDDGVDEYIIRGFSNHEEWGTWTDGHTAVMRFSITSNCEEVLGIISGGAFNNEQKIEVYVNNTKVFSDDSFAGGNIEFTFKNPGSDCPVELRLELPDAISPTAFGSSDVRVLGLGVQSMCFLERKYDL